MKSGWTKLVTLQMRTLRTPARAMRYLRSPECQKQHWEPAFPTLLGVCYRNALTRAKANQLTFSKFQTDTVLISSLIKNISHNKMPFARLSCSMPFVWGGRWWKLLIGLFQVSHFQKSVNDVNSLVSTLVYHSHKTEQFLYLRIKCSLK